MRSYRSARRGSPCATASSRSPLRTSTLSPSEELREQYGKWLASLTWDTFGMYTFRERRTVARAGELFTRFLERPRISEGMRMVVWGAEPHPGGHGGHVHALIRWHPWLEKRREALEHFETWRRRRGYCGSAKYDPARGAAHYLTKYVLKDARQSGTWGVWTWQTDSTDPRAADADGGPRRMDDEGSESLAAIWETQAQVEARLDEEGAG